MIKVLGADGSYSHKTEATAFLIGKNIVIDAGNIIKSMGWKCCEIEHIFITHTHFDHIIDLPFIIDSYFECREKPLNIYALRENIDILKQYIFNWTIWPNFEKIFNAASKISVNFVPIDIGRTFTINDIEITAVGANHSVPTCGFKVKYGESAFLFSGDTYINHKLIEMINRDSSITSLLIDVSLNSHEEKLAYTSKHLTPKLLESMLRSLRRDDVTIYTYHQKPLHAEKIDRELHRLGLLKNGGKRLCTGDIIDIFTSAQKRQTPKNLELYYNDRDYISSLFTLLEEIREGRKQTQDLLADILEHTMKLTHADSALLCRADKKTGELQQCIFRNNTLRIGPDRYTRDATPCDLPEYPVPDSAVFAMPQNKKAVKIDDLSATDPSEFARIKTFDRATGYRTRTIVIVPLLDSDSRLCGSIQVMNKQSIYNETIPFDAYDEQSVLTFASQASSVLRGCRDQDS